MKKINMLAMGAMLALVGLVNVGCAGHQAMHVKEYGPNGQVTFDNQSTSTYIGIIPDSSGSHYNGPSIIVPSSLAGAYGNGYYGGGFGVNNSGAQQVLNAMSPNCGTQYHYGGGGYHY